MLWKNRSGSSAHSDFLYLSKTEFQQWRRKANYVSVSQGACFPSGFWKLFPLVHKEGSGLKLRHAENRITPAQFPEEWLYTEVLSWTTAEVSNKTIIPAIWKDIYVLTGQQQMANWSTRTVALTGGREASTGAFVLALLQDWGDLVQVPEACFALGGKNEFYLIFMGLREDMEDIMDLRRQSSGLLLAAELWHCSHTNYAPLAALHRPHSSG